VSKQFGADKRSTPLLEDGAETKKSVRKVRCLRRASIKRESKRQRGAGSDRVEEEIEIGKVDTVGTVLRGLAT